jgi:hypothetical protein
MTKSKPRLHLVRGDQDPELYCADLDWYYGQYDSECGLKSIGISSALDAISTLGSYTTAESNSAITVKVSISRDLQKWFEGGPWDDHHAQFRGRGDFCAFTRGRRIHARLGVLPWTAREFLRQYYEARQLWERDEDYWHDDGPARFDTSAREIADTTRAQKRQTGFRGGRVELPKADVELIRAYHRQYYLKQEAA